MGNKLAILAIAGLSISAVSLTAAAMVGGQELRNHGINIFDWNDKPDCSFNASAGDDRLVLPWSGGNSVTIAMDAQVYYRAGSGEMVEITGNPQSLTHVRIAKGKIELDCDGAEDGLAVTLPGRAFKSFSLFGDGNVVLENLDQASLDIVVTGGGTIEASGRTDDLEISLIGDGTARMAELIAQDVEINIIGDGIAEVDARDSLEVNLVGDGTVRYKTEPKSIDTNIVGSGRITQIRDRARAD